MAICVSQCVGQSDARFLPAIRPSFPTDLAKPKIPLLLFGKPMDLRGKILRIRETIELNPLNSQTYNHSHPPPAPPMDKHSPTVFAKIDHLHTPAPEDSSEMILQDLFSEEKWHSGPPSPLVMLSLTEKFLYLSDSKESGLSPQVRQFCEISFDLKFELGREKTQPGAEASLEKQPLGVPYCLKFQRQGCKTLYLYSDRVDTLIQWKHQLEKMINRRGFHELFRPIKKIGKGNFASVYLAQRLEDNKLVAVKAFSKEATYSQDKGKEALLNEINVLRKLSHQNVLKLHAVFESDNSIYMTMQLLEGQQLFTRIQSKHKFSHEETRHIMEGLLKGLAHMHTHKIMHRDLKPENIMIKSKQTCDVVIVDFGLATAADEETYLFVRCGTPGYVAPEIINIKNMNSKSDPICDVFSIGLIFHILLLGRPVFPGRTYNEVLTQNRACDFNLFHKDYSEISSHSHDLLIKMLDKNPQSRISAKEALNHSYFSKMDIELFPPSEMTDITKFGSNQFNQAPKLLNKVSICSGQDSYLKALRNTTTENKASRASNSSSQKPPNQSQSRRQKSCNKENACFE